MGRYVYPVYAYRRPAELDAPAPRRVPLVVIGAGPVGLTAAIDLAQRGVPVLLLDEDKTVSVGSRGICYAKRTLEIWDRLGCVGPMMDKGVTWQKGRVFFRDREVYAFDLLPEGGHRFPAFINLQQYWLEQFLVEAAARQPTVELRWQNKVVGVTPDEAGVRIDVETPDGRYALDAGWVIAADGARSAVRRMLGLEFRGQVFQDRFLIADVRIDAEFPPERRFWFDPPFHQGRSALLHKQADGLWRIDLQLGWNADPEEEKKPERIAPRLKAMFGPDARFEIEWASVYTFQCRRLDRFRHGRVIFVGDAAHQVSPFGARGANSGVQDADNLCWKLAAVIAGLAPERLLDSYDAERCAAADENILHSTRATDFISPKGGAARLFRDAVLGLSETHPFAQRLINSGRLSLPAVHADSALNTPDADTFTGGMRPGTTAADAPVRHDGANGWLLSSLRNGFCGLYFTDGPVAADVAQALTALNQAPVPVRTTVVAPAPIAVPGLHAVVDAEGLAARRYDARPGTYYLLRPDQHVCARWRDFDAASVRAAVGRAMARVPHG